MKNINCNKTFNKNEMQNLINWFISNYGSIRTNKLLDKLKNVGFLYATQSGISLGLEDLKIPQTKKNILLNTEKELKRNKIERGD